MLREFERRVVDAVARTLLPLEELGGVDPVALVDRFLQESEPPMRDSSRLMLLAVEFSPLFWGLGPRRFSSLPAERRTQLFHRMERSPRWEVRNFFFGLKILVMGVVYDEPAVARAICRSR